jgi:hypothetical protein
VFSHSVLHRGKFSLLRKRFYGVNLLACHHGQQHQATVDWRIKAACTVWANHDHAAGAAFAFGTALFAPGQALCTKKIEERGVQTSLGLHTSSIQMKFNELTELAIR